MQRLSFSDPRSFAIPIISASVIVAIVLLLASTQWMYSESVVTKVPKQISARIVHLEKKQPKKSQQTKKSAANKQPVNQAPNKKVVKVNKKADVVKPQKVDKPKPKVEKVKPLPGADLNEALQQESAQRELQQLLEEEMAAQQADKEQAAIVDHITKIQQLVQSVWRFPPSAKHDDVVTLRLYLVPTGEITEVQIIEGSGNEALDRSAEQALWKLARLPVPKDSVLFERQFRQLVLKLKPENARL